MDASVASSCHSRTASPYHCSASTPCANRFWQPTRTCSVGSVSPSTLVSCGAFCHSSRRTWSVDQTRSRLERAKAELVLLRKRRPLFSRTRSLSATERSNLVARDALENFEPHRARQVVLSRRTYGRVDRQATPPSRDTLPERDTEQVLHRVDVPVVLCDDVLREQHRAVAPCSTRSASIAP